MTNKEACRRGMDALAARDTFTVNTKGKASAKPYDARKDKADDGEAKRATAAADAEAWNMLNHLSKVV